jgi:hypothetical protein
MVSFHARAASRSPQTTQMNLGNQLRLHRTGFQRFSNVAQFRSTPIVIGEADPELRRAR